MTPLWWAADGACNGAAWLAARGNVARGVAGGLLRDAGRLVYQRPDGTTINPPPITA